ncbi:C4-dicarboxylate ABC transporter [Thauera terpenica 58Eu]|jgi:TRAP-type mannitol/chloroaromatic compound transport system permease large subunit|uniref:C4-dicarboxylate ABC transporter n=1 Tax=Thauera terpenica 58Eu TaxID=1348657 RepID=T0ASQ7_9RHOO|nr:TRAP transporter large permease subunit [Thauera terpenica]EPZ13718.1 C4-dicarboxylate ABC transporter [Thauera terpenica 58Eu]MBP6800793.1 TRAP transporter large permease subunit [Zoogloea sp.]
MTELFAAHVPELMFGSLILFLLTGFPVAFSLASCGLLFGFLGMEFGLLPASLFQALPLRVFGIIQNETLLAIPFFTLMGLILERSGMAEDLLDTVGQVFGPIRGGLALAVLFVGALLAATTGVVAASVISMGLISLPIMLRFGYSPAVASGAITASGTLAQILPPSLVLIVMADQLGRSVGDLYKGAFIPAFALVALYALFIIGLAIFKPKLVPALPPEARHYREPNGHSGMRSLLVFGALVTTVSVVFGLNYSEILSAFKGEEISAPLDETIVLALTCGTLLAFFGALINKALGFGLLSRITERVTFVLIPPLALIFLVLGTIFLGIATPTEGGAMGAIGGMAMAFARGKLDLPLLRNALESTARLSCFVLFILIGSTIFSFTFTAVDGQIWVEHLFDKLPGGQIGFLVFVNVVIFFLGFFIDFFEIAFILVPLLAPVADKLGIDLVWFGVLLAMNLQTSFLTPPFGFALFYLRSVAPAKDYLDRITGKNVASVKTMDIYRGSIPFVIIQIAMVAALIAFPGLVTSGLDKAVKVDLDTIEINVQSGDDGGWGQQEDAWGGGSPRPEGDPALDSKRPQDGETPPDSGDGGSTGFGNTQRGW